MTYKTKMAKLGESQCQRSTCYHQAKAHFVYSGVCLYCVGDPCLSFLVGFMDQPEIMRIQST